MQKALLYICGASAPLHYAEKELRALNVPLIDHPAPEATHLLLDVPTFDIPSAKKQLDMLSDRITVIGGKLPPLPCRTIDLLRDPLYLARNAQITAHCAMQLAASELNRVYVNLPVLILGWGRIGKCLSFLLKSQGAQVHIAARSAADRALASALGFSAHELADLPGILPSFRLLFNTVPAPVLSAADAELCRDCVLIDLASQPGIDSDRAISARGLPGKLAPESAGILIAQTVFRLIKEEAQWK